MAPSKQKSNENKIEGFTLKPSEVLEQIKFMTKVNLKLAASGQSRSSMMLWGPPGIGKSDVMRQAADQMGFDFVDIRLIQMEPTDLRGIPVPVTDANGITTVTWAMLKLLPKAMPNSRDAERPTIVFLDELPNAAPSVQAASYQLVLDGRLGEYRLPDNCVVFAAGNRETDKGGTFKMPTPLINRFTHIEMVVDFEDWQRYALGLMLHRDVVGYLTAFKHELFQFNPASVSRGFPTPRSWKSVSNFLYEAEDSGLRAKNMLATIGGTVGDGIAVKFNEFRENMGKLPAASDILLGKVTKLDSQDVSLMYALTIAMAYELKAQYNEYLKTPGSENVNNNTEDAKRFHSAADNFFGFMLNNFQPEIVVLGARTILAIHQIGFNTKLMKNWEIFSKKFGDLVLQA